MVRTPLASNLDTTSSLNGVPEKHGGRLESQIAVKHQQQPRLQRKPKEDNAETE